MIEAFDEGNAIDEIANDIRENNRCEAGKDCAAEATYLFPVMTEKPLYQTVRAAKLTTNHRGPQGQKTRPGHFTEQLAAAIEIACVGRIRFRIHSFASRKDTVGADMNQSGAHRSTEVRYAMRKKGIACDAP